MTQQMNAQMTLFRFDPNLSDAPLARGRYDAQITDAQPRISKAGNPMLELTVRTAASNGNVVILRDWLVSTPRTKWKIRQFCKGVGLDYHAGEIDPERLKGRDVTIEVGVEEDREGRDRSVITDYLPVPEGGAALGGKTRDNQPIFGRQPVADAEEGDEIPF